MKNKGNPKGKTREKVLKLRIQGYNYREIADKLDISNESARKMFQHGMEAIEKDMTETYWEQRQLDLERLDMILKANLSALEDVYVCPTTGDEIKTPNVKAADVAMKAMDRRARLLGLNAEEAAPMTTLSIKVNNLLKKDVSEMSDDDLDQFFQDHWNKENSDDV